MKRTALPTFAGLLLILSACGTPGPGATPRANRNLITREDMLAVNASTVYEAVQKINPSWLSSRGPVSATDPTPTVANVFMSGNQVGDVEFLRTLRPDDVNEVRYYEAGEAGARFGMGHPRGVIEVIPRGD